MTFSRNSLCEKKSFFLPRAAASRKYFRGVLNNGKMNHTSYPEKLNHFCENVSASKQPFSVHIMMSCHEWILIPRIVVFFYKNMLPTTNKILKQIKMLKFKCSFLILYCIIEKKAKSQKC